MGDKGLYKFTWNVSVAIRWGHQVNCYSGQRHGAPVPEPCQSSVI